MAANQKLTARVSVTDAFGDIVADTRVHVLALVPGCRPHESGGYQLVIRSRDIAGARREVSEFLKKFLDDFFPRPPA